MSPRAEWVERGRLMKHVSILTNDIMTMRSELQSLLREIKATLSPSEDRHPIYYTLTPDQHAKLVAIAGRKLPTEK